MKVLLVSTYELGHQPWHLASPAAALEACGHDVRMLDLAVEPWSDGMLSYVDAVAISVPMHTATRLALDLADRIAEARPEVPVALYGLYAAVGAGDSVGDRVAAAFAGEYEPALLHWLDSISDNALPASISRTGRSDFRIPVRAELPPLESYARLSLGGTDRLAGYTEASHGCAFRCRHCPVPVVYDGRSRIVPIEAVLADIGQQVEAGARHITFGDPDFMSGPKHAARVIEAFAGAFPGISFDVTTKVENILAHAGFMSDLADAGCIFVVTAVETLNDHILALLDKGHTAADAARAVETLRSAGIEPRPSFLPFTPWTAIADVVDIFEFVRAHELVRNVDPVQYSLRLLIPEGSLLLAVDELDPYLDGYDAAALTWRWHAAEPATDSLQARLAGAAEAGVDSGRDQAMLYGDMRRLVFEAAGRPDPYADTDWCCIPDTVPGLTEDWFCCAEPTDAQRGSLDLPGSTARTG